MFKLLREKISGLRGSLTRMDDQPLGKAALIIVIFLDIFVLFSMFYGLEQHTAQLVSPRERVPGLCREIVLEGQWNETARMDELARELDSRTGSYYRHEERTTPLHPLCERFILPIERMEGDAALTEQMQKWQQLTGESYDARNNVERLKGAYDTALLEDMARPEAERQELDAMAAKLREATALLNSLEKRIAKIEAAANANVEVQALWAAIGSITEQERALLREDLRGLNFWFPLKTLLMQMVFLLPLFGLFYVWHSRSVRRGRGLQALISAHLLVVASIPILLKVIEAVYDVIPKNILKKLIDLLASLKLVALWHYLLIGVAVAVALVLVYIFQRKLFNRAWLMEKRISKSLCQSCGKKLPGDLRACPFCGFVQFTTCPSCQGQTYVHGRHCRECGGGK